MLKDLFKGFLKILYPPRCLTCKSAIPEEMVLCQRCLNTIEKIQPPFCSICGSSVFDNELLCKKCKKSHPPFKHAWSICKYEGVTKECIHLFKYNSKLRLNKVFKKLISEFIANYHLPLADIDFIVPVPLHKSRFREREFNQAEILAQNIAEEFGIELESKLITRVRNTASQINLPKSERINNVRGAFAVNKRYDLDSKNVLLVDDVFTTGATIQEVASTLKEAKAKDIYVLTLARS